MKSILLAALMALAIAAPAAASTGDGMSCLNLKMLQQTVCRTTLDGKTTYTLSQDDSSSSSISVITESEYDSAVKIDTEATAKLTAAIHADNVRNEAIDKYGKRYYEKALSCIDGGGEWHRMRHTCSVEGGK